MLELAPASLAFALSSSPKQEDLETEQLDKHEKALLSQVVKPQDVAVAFDSIGGLDDAKKALREAITYPLKYPSLYQDGVAREACKGVLLFGPPGTGKTMLAKAVATEGGAAFLAIDASSIENKWLGESEKNAKAVFSLARRLAPCVVYIDEVDAVLSSREGGDDTSHGTLTSVKTTLMQEWDGLRTTQDRVVVIGSTNRPYDLDEAVLRRMPRRILVDLPDLQTREEILRVTLRDNAIDDDVDLSLLAKKLEGYSGRTARRSAARPSFAFHTSTRAELDALSASDELDGACVAALDPPPLRAACMADFEKPSIARGERRRTGARDGESSGVERAVRRGQGEKEGGAELALRRASISMDGDEPKGLGRLEGCFASAPWSPTCRGRGRRPPVGPGAIGYWNVEEGRRHGPEGRRRERLGCRRVRAVLLFQRRARRCAVPRPHRLEDRVDPAGRVRVLRRLHPGDAREAPAWQAARRRATLPRPHPTAPPGTCS